MRKPVGILCLVVLLFVRSAPAAQGSSSKGSVDAVPPVILTGLEAYKDKGPEEAVKAWIKGSAIDGSKEALSQANNLRMIQDFMVLIKHWKLFQREIWGRRLA